VTTIITIVIHFMLSSQLTSSKCIIKITTDAAYYGYLAFLHVKVVDDDSNEKVEREKRPENDETDEIHVHVVAVFSFWLSIRL